MAEQFFKLLPVIWNLCLFITVLQMKMYLLTLMKLYVLRCSQWRVTVAQSRESYLHGTAQHHFDPYDQRCFHRQKPTGSCMLDMLAEETYFLEDDIVCLC